jgi:hypothetical protein
LNAGVLLYFAVNVKFKTWAESWLVTMKTIATTVAAKARSLRVLVKILLLLAMEVKLLLDD